MARGKKAERAKQTGGQEGKKIQKIEEDGEE